MTELSNSEAKSGYMKFVVDFYKTMVDKHIILAYEGEVTQDITKAFTSMTEKNLSKIEEDDTIKKKVYHVMVECLQNIAKHANDDTETASDNLSKGLSKSGIFIISSDNKEYFISFGNSILNGNINALKELLDHVNALDKDGLKELYKSRMKETVISDKGGAGLGFIDIARKTGNPLEYHFEPINSKKSFFLLKSRINRLSTEE
jgi:hypothetical protein